MTLNGEDITLDGKDIVNLMINQGRLEEKLSNIEKKVDSTPDEIFDRIEKNFFIRFEYMEKRITLNRTLIYGIISTQLMLVGWFIKGG